MEVDDMVVDGPVIALSILNAGGHGWVL